VALTGFVAADDGPGPGFLCVQGLLTAAGSAGRVLFPSFTFHEVEKVDTAGDEWDRGRFSVNYWIGFR
jgi:hypothetical protein